MDGTGSGLQSSSNASFLATQNMRVVPFHQMSHCDVLSQTTAIVILLMSKGLSSFRRHTNVDEALFVYILALPGHIFCNNCFHVPIAMRSFEDLKLFCFDRMFQ